MSCPDLLLNTFAKYFLKLFDLLFFTPKFCYIADNSNFSLEIGKNKPQVRPYTLNVYKIFLHLKSLRLVHIFRYIII